MSSNSRLGIKKGKNTLKNTLSGVIESLFVLDWGVFTQTTQDSEVSILATDKGCVGKELKGLYHATPTVLSL